MSVAIVTRRLRDYSHPRGTILATDVPSKREAVSLVRRLARSYPEHGAYAGSQVHWFRDHEGLTEIWAQDIAPK